MTPTIRCFRFVRLNLRWLLPACTLALAGCEKPVVKPSEPVTSRVDGEKVTFETNAPQLASISVQTAAARRMAVSHVTGRLYWNDDTTVRIFTPVIGRVTRLLSDLGDTIAVGAPLAEIDSPDYAQALANARTAVGNLMAADKALTRTKSLLAHGAYARKDLEAAQAAYISALAERDRSVAVLNNYGGGQKIYDELTRAENDNRDEARQMGYAGSQSTNGLFLLRSRLAGVLVEKNINPGQEVRPDMMLANAPPVIFPLFVVSDPTTLWLQVDIAESDLPALQEGLALRVTSKAFPGKVFAGRIDKMGLAMDPVTRIVRIRGSVANPDRLLRAEMYVMVDVERDGAALSEAGVEVPAKALFMKGSDSFLFIEEAPGVYRRQKVRVGVEKDDIVPIFDGLNSGQKVVTEGALLLQALVEPAG